MPSFEGTFFAPILQAIDNELRASNLHMVAARNIGHGPRRENSCNRIHFLVDRECDVILVIDSYRLDDGMVARIFLVNGYWALPLCTANGTAWH